MNKIRIYITILLLALFCLKGFSQVESVLNNDSIKYRTLRTSFHFETPKIAVPSKTLIQIIMDSTTRAKIKSYTYSEWMNLLRDKKTDWAANLCLYDFYELNASDFDLWQNRNRWAQCCKPDDIAYWKKNLPH